MPMTLEAALKIVYRELGIKYVRGCKGGPLIEACATTSKSLVTRYGECPHGQIHPHDLPMPPLDDGLLAVILRRLRDELSERYGQPELVVVDDILRKYWTKGTDPVTAAVMAFAQYLEARNG